MPRSPYRVQVDADAAYRGRIRPRSIAALVRRVLEAEQAPGTTVSIVVTNDAVVQRLNSRFRGEDRPTDVLSFNLDGDEAFVVGRSAQLGEIVISFPTAMRQAREAGHRIEAELAHLIVHGALHLLGYDHQRRADERVMRTREEALLGRKLH
jgi:probable rRNA maturation factor